MCFLMSVTNESLYSRWGELLTDSEVPDYYCASGFTHPLWPVLCTDSPGRVELVRWGLVPFWVKDEEQARSIRRNTLNARAETIFQKPSFRACAPRQRCLVLVDGFFEPHKHAGKSYQFYCHMHDGSAFAFAGLYSYWRNPSDGRTTKSFSIITTEANELLSVVHNEKRRMPAILSPDEHRRWLDPELRRPAVESLLAAKEVPGLTAHTVSRSVSTRNADPFDPDTQRHVAYPELAHLRIA